MFSELGIIITNRDRPEPLYPCLQSLAAQSLAPAWVAIADLGSSREGAGQLEEIADTYLISYLQIAYFAQWNQALAFNTALRRMPAVRHVIQLDADLILHPYLLEFTQKALQSVQAMCCVPSYIDVRDVPFDYDGSTHSFGKLLSKAYGGNRLSRGGYVVLPREWLVASGSFDEAYQGWGFEDADLWWRVEQQHTTYEEISGSFIIHQSHPRQAGATDVSGNPNWYRYQQRISSVPLSVNPTGFGRAPVSREVIRDGIRPLPELGDQSSPWTNIRVRTRQGERLRPAQGMVAADPDQLIPAQLMEVRRANDVTAKAPVTILIELDDSQRGMLGASLDSLASQSVLPDQVILRVRASDPDFASWRAAYVPYFYLCEVAEMGDAAEHARDIQSALDHCRAACHSVLLMSGGLLVHPRALELLSAMERADPCLLQGPVHALPPAARELQLIQGTPWHAWSAIAHLEDREMGKWRFFPQAHPALGRFWDGLPPHRDEWSDPEQRADDLSQGQPRRLPEDVILFLACPLKVDLSDIYR